jgi:hypothetical protein
LSFQKDDKLKLAENQGPITASAQTEDAIGFGAPVADAKSVGKAFFTVKTGATGTGSVTFQLEDCDTEGGSYATIAASKDYPVAELTEGKIIEVPLPGNHQEFVAGRFAVTGTVAALVCDCHIVG